MRKSGELKFNPIKFESYGINGSVGTKSPDEFFRSALSQNICYCVRNTARTVNEIAEEMGVSPVYVETEVEFLEEYGFLIEQKGKYIVNFIINEPTAELLVLTNNMYRRAAELFANELFDRLISSDILEDSDIQCAHADRNFILWSLIPFIAASSGEKLMDKHISFEEVATIRPDGAHNIFQATVLDGDMTLPKDYVHIKNWCGPMWNGKGEHILWQVDSEWSDRGKYSGMQYAADASRTLLLYQRERKEFLFKDEYAWLAERGYVKTSGEHNSGHKSEWQIVILARKEIQNRLISIGEEIKKKYRDEFTALKAPYAKAVLEQVPMHLRKIREYELQFVFNSEGRFLMHCIIELLNKGKLKPPTEEQKKSLSTLIVNS